MDSNTINENIITAMDILISKKLEDLKYDVTKTCTIVDNTYKQIGRYTVQEETLKYEAYSTNTALNIDDVVLVMVPNGDYNELKIILNKVATDADLTSSVAYVSPLKSMVSFTDNIIDSNSTLINSKFGNKNDNKYFSLLANGENKVGYLNPEVLTSILLYTIEDWSYNNFERLGISADFRSWLKDLDATSGDYGLELLFFDSNSSIVDLENKENATYRFTFGINDILGNPYNFPTYFTQEKVIDISSLENIQTLAIYFYQKGNFKNEEGNYITNQEDNGSKLLNNLFVGNIKLYVGYDTEKYSTDAITIVSNSKLTYSSLRAELKEMSLNWVHKIDEYNYEIINGSNIGDKEIEIYWRRYDPTAANTWDMDIVGANWIYREEELIIQSDDNFKCNLNMVGDITQENNIQVKAVCRIKDNNNWLTYTSNIITFTTEDETYDKTTYDVITGLAIYCDDNGYNGNYFIYGADNNINDKSEGRSCYRYFQLRYNGALVGTASSGIYESNIDNIEWTITLNIEGLTPVSMIHYPDVSTKSSSVSTGISPILRYTLLDTWYPYISKNDIKCKITLKSGEIYTAFKTLLFGKADSQGSNYNLVIEYKDLSRNAYEVSLIDNNQINTNKIEEVELIGSLFGASKPIDEKEINVDGWKWEFIGESIFLFIPGTTSLPIAKIKLKNGIEKLEKNFTIVLLTYTYKKKNEQDDSSEKVYLIIALKPIAIKTKNSSNELRCNTMAGADEIRYNSSGTNPKYYTGAYTLYDSEHKEINDVVWSMIPEEPPLGYPTLKLISENSNKKALSANTLFLKDELYQICVIAKVNDIIYWIQPIRITLSQYDVAITNEWDGTTTTTDDTSIKAATIAAGKKNSDETFSGIVLGEVKEGETSQVGLYGFSYGKVTYSLSENGLVKIDNKTDPNKTENNDSDDTRVDIAFGPENRIISHSVKAITENNNNIEKGYYDYLEYDIDNRELISKHKLIDGLTISTGNPYLRLKNEEDKNMLLFNTTDFIIQSPGFSDTSGLKLDVKNGTIIVNNKSVKFSKGENYIGTESNGINLLKLGKLSVTSEGEVQYNGLNLEKYINSLIDAKMNSTT